MKAGTTTAYQWLAAHPGTSLPAVKEPDFFCRDDNFKRGLDFYRSHFAGQDPSKLTGEASVKYTAPATNEISATRIRETLPDVKLVMMVRDPIERLRSEYRFSLQRGWETGDFADVMAKPGNFYVGKSSYHLCLKPYLDRFARDQILVLNTEYLNASGDAWSRLLAFLGLDPMPVPEDVFNETDNLPQMRPIAGFLNRPLIRKSIAKLPARVRRMGRVAITDADPDAPEKRRLASLAALPEGVVDLLRADAEQFSAAVGWDGWIWPSLAAR